jgi:hypothetical protein
LPSLSHEEQQDVVDNRVEGIRIEIEPSSRYGELLAAQMSEVVTGHRISC